MTSIYHYASVSKALNKLKDKGFTYDFNINENDILKHPENFFIRHIYQYEGESNPDDSSTVYGIVSKFGIKGVFVTGSSANSFSESSKIITRLEIKDNCNTAL